MRLLFLLGLFALMIFSTVSTREIRGEKRYRKYGILPSKDKRGAIDFSHIQKPTNGGYTSNYFTPINTPSHSTSFSFGQSTPSLGGIGGYGHGLSLGSIDLTGQTFSLPLSYGSSSSLLSSSGKTGPVTFGLQGGTGSQGQTAYTAPVYATGIQGLSAYGNGGHTLSLPIITLSGHGQSYSLPASSGFTSVHGAGGGGVGGSGAYSLSGASQTYNIPVSTSHGVTGGLVYTPSASSTSSAGSHASTSSHESPSSSYQQLSSNSADTSNYQQPSTSSYSSSYPSSESHSYSNYQPASSEGNAYTSSNSNEVYPSSHSSSSYSSPTASYSSPLSSYNEHNYSPSGSYSAPSSAYTQSYSGYNSHAQPSASYSSAEQQSTYSQMNPSYVSYAQPKYDTISYSGSQEKY